ncbi:MAG: hypothetical protein IJ899_14515 [Blautia sp.]|nr:hypothetical protein [Blautia sp.]
MNLEEQYDRIYKFLYFRLHDQHAAEDLTQETFLRFIGSRTYPLMKKSVSCLMCLMDMLYSTLLLLAVKAKRSAGTRKLIWIKSKVHFEKF